MLSTTIKRAIATALSGAAIAGTVGAPAASAMPIDPAAARGEPRSPTVPTLPAVSATHEPWQPAMSRYHDLEANKAKSMQALGLAMMQRSFVDAEAIQALTAQAR